MRSTTQLLVAGASSPDIHKLIEAINRAGHGQPHFEVVAFLEIDDDLVGKEVQGVPIIDEREIEAADYPGVGVVNNVGRSMRARRQTTAGLVRKGFTEFVSLADPGVDLWEVSLGRGCLVLQGCVFGPFVQIGDQCLILAGANMNHEVELGNHVFVGPGATVLGRVVLEDGVYVGGGATLLTGVRVETGSIIGAGSVVTRDVSSGVVVAGNPAQVLRPVNESEIFSPDLTIQPRGSDEI